MFKTAILTLALSISLLLESSGKISDTLSIGTTKTIVLVFPDSINEDGVDLGLPATHANGRTSGKKYFIYAKARFKETSLHIELKSGYIYTFIIEYSENPLRLLLPYSYKEATFTPPVEEAENDEEPPAEITKCFPNIPTEKSKKDEKVAIIKPTEGKKKTVKTVSAIDLECKDIIDRPFNIAGAGIQQGRMVFLLESIFIRFNKLYFEVSVENKSNLKYDIAFIKFLITDGKGSTSSDEIVTNSASAQSSYIEPVYEYESGISTVDPKSKVKKVFVFEKFSIDPDEYLYFQLGENTGRMLEFKIPSKEILKAKSL